MEELLLGGAILAACIVIAVGANIATEASIKDDCFVAGKFTIHINGESHDFKCELVKPEKQMVEE